MLYEVITGVEAGGRGTATGDHAARMNGLGRPGIVQGYKSLFLHKVREEQDSELLKYLRRRQHINTEDKSKFLVFSNRQGIVPRWSWDFV